MEVVLSEKKIHTPLKDNKIFRWIAIPICIALCLFGRFIPPFPGLPAAEPTPLLHIPSSDAMGVLTIFLGCLIMWLTIGIDWPSIVCIFSLALLKNGGFSSVFTGSFGNSTFVFLLFTFICTYALSKTSLIKKFALFMVKSKFAKEHGALFVFLFLLGVLIIGMFMSPSVLFVAILPLATEIMEMAGVTKGDRLGKMIMMGLGFTVSISSGMTTIGHVFPVLAMTATEIQIAPITYSLFAIPAGLVTFLIMYGMFILILRPDFSCLKNVDVSKIDENLAKPGKADYTILGIFVGVIILWILPTILQYAGLDTAYSVINGWGTAMAPMLGTILLCIIRINNKPLINITDAFKNGIPWSALLMCASTLILASMLTKDAVGIKTFLSNNIGSYLQKVPFAGLLFIFLGWAAIQTNLSSNMVTATLVATVAASVLKGIPASSGIDIGAVGALIGMLASFAFATPPSMPHIAIVAGSEYCDTKNTLAFGSLLMVVSVLVAVCIYPLANALIF